MKLIKVIGWLSGLSIIAYYITITIQDILVIHEANDDIDYKALEDEIFKQIELERGRYND